MYREVASGSVSHVFHGYNACVFAYGPTGSGKTYTMYGPGGGDTRNDSFKGIVPRCAQAIFQEAEGRTPYTDASVAVSLCEIYCDKIRDLGKAYAHRGDKGEKRHTDTHTHTHTQTRLRSDHAPFPFISPRHRPQSPHVCILLAIAPLPFP